MSDLRGDENLIKIFPPVESQTHGAEQDQEKSPSFSSHTATEAAASSPPQISVETLLTVANYSLNDEAGRAEKLDGIESKFFALLKYNIIASAFIFTTEVNKGRMDVFSIILILPYLEMSEFLARHSLCEGKIQKLLKDHFIAPLLSSQV